MLISVVLVLISACPMLVLAKQSLWRWILMARLSSWRGGSWMDAIAIE